MAQVVEQSSMNLSIGGLTPSSSSCQPVPERDTHGMFVLCQDNILRISFLLVRKILQI